MLKEIDLDKTLYVLIDQYPELLDILYTFGFDQIKSQGMLQTAGRFMTLRKGCELKKIDQLSLINRLNRYGYTIKED